MEYIMIYKISGNQRLIWKFYKTDDNKWRWYCHEKNGYLLSQSDNAYNSQFGFAPIFPDTCHHLTHYWPAAVDIPVASDNP
ncbi:hypothetical protein FCY18_23955, partial [Escherichia coli]|nr:hypothetical protein [Escherichia coli]